MDENLGFEQADGGYGDSAAAAADGFAEMQEPALAVEGNGGDAGLMDAPPPAMEPPAPQPQAQAQAPQMPARHGSAGSVGSDAALPPAQPSAATLAWRAEAEKRAKARDQENEKKRRELQAQADAKLQALKAERQKRIAAAAAANKDAAKDLVPSSKTTGWAKVAQLVEIDKEVPERERMRQVLRAKAKEG